MRLKIAKNDNKLHLVIAIKALMYNKIVVYLHTKHDLCKKIMFCATISF